MLRSARCVILVAGVLFLVLPAAAIACLWDYDTIRMERSRFPDTLELITGKFLRHSPEFYQWRIQDRLKRLETDPTNAALLDDLAVAYDKVGEHDKAIETALTIEESQPGRYETASNLATFYFHAGTPELGLPYIERALQINPDAHFGREKYQKLLTEYVLRQREGNPDRLPLANAVVKYDELRPDDPYVKVDETFVEYLRSESYERLSREENQAAVKGVLGMMRFAKYDSPILLEALGSLLTEQHDPEDDAKLLATRAFLMASYEAPEGPVRDTYRAMAAKALQMQTPRITQGQISLEQVEEDFQRELADARAWYADLCQRELLWIREGRNPETEFDRLYAADPEIPGMDLKDPMTPDEKWEQTFRILGVVFRIMGVLCVLFIVAGVVMASIYIRRRWKGSIASP